MMFRGEECVANDVLKFKKVIEFQSSKIVTYFKIDSSVLQQLVCTGKISKINSKGEVIEVRNVQQLQFLLLTCSFYW